MGKKPQVQQFLMAMAELYGIFSRDEVMELGQVFGWWYRPEEIDRGAAAIFADGMLSTIEPGEGNDSGEMWYVNGLMEEEFVMALFEAVYKRPLHIPSREQMEQILEKFLFSLTPDAAAFAQYLMMLEGMDPEKAFADVTALLHTFRSSPVPPAVLLERFGLNLFPDDLAGETEAFRGWMDRLAQSVSCWVARGRPMSREDWVFQETSDLDGLLMRLLAWLTACMQMWSGMIWTFPL